MQQKIHRRLSTSENLRWGLRVAIGVAAVYCLWILAVYGVMGNAPFAANRVSMSRVLAVYACLGTAAGVALGLLRPTLSSVLGANSAGLIIGAVVGIGMSIARDGLPGRWDLADWITTVALTVGVGALVAHELRRRFVPSRGPAA